MSEDIRNTQTQPLPTVGAASEAETRAIPAVPADGENAPTRLLPVADTQVLRAVGGDPETAVGRPQEPSSVASDAPRPEAVSASMPEPDLAAELEAVSDAVPSPGRGASGEPPRESPRGGAMPGEPVARPVPPRQTGMAAPAAGMVPQSGMAAPNIGTVPQTGTTANTGAVPQTGTAAPIAGAMPQTERREPVPQPTAAGAPRSAPSQPGPAGPMATGGAGPYAANRQVPLYSTMPPVQNGAGPSNYVQVPVERPKERPVIRRRGPSAATIVFGVLLVCCGVVAILFGMGFPVATLPMFGADPRVAIAVGCGAFGALLVVVAVVWAVVRIVRPKHDDDKPEKA